MRTLIAWFVLLAATQAAGQCLGDFNRDGMVRVDELVTAVGNALDGCQVTGPRFVDNDDGTVTDTQTGLMWEEKTGSMGLHYIGNLYSWSGMPTRPDGYVFIGFLYTMNLEESPDGMNSNTSPFSCFAGHCDWRLPTIHELRTLLAGPYPCTVNPCIDPMLGTTLPGFYWSLTEDATNNLYVWGVDFSDGSVVKKSKLEKHAVRAVRTDR